MNEALSLAVVGMGFREGPTVLRGKLVALDEAPDSPSRALLENGTLKGVVRVHTCSRVEWVLSAENPAWAAQLLRGALLSRAGAEAKGRDLHLKVGPAAARYLTRVTLGLEAVAEGEGAVGRQVLKAFEQSRKAGTTDRQLHTAWKALERTVRKRRDEAPARAGHGVQALVVAALKTLPKDARLLVFGMGEMGKATARALQREGFGQVRGFGRATHAGFLAEAEGAHAVVIASGAAQPHLQLPQRTDAPMVLDVGSPPQLLAAPGWKALGLDELLGEGSASLADGEAEKLDALCEQAAQELIRALQAPLPGETLGALDKERRAFMEQQLPSLLENLPPKEAKKVKAQVAQFAHQLLKRTRGDQT